MAGGGRCGGGGNPLRTCVQLLVIGEGLTAYGCTATVEANTSPVGQVGQVEKEGAAVKVEMSDHVFLALIFLGVALVLWRSGAFSTSDLLTLVRGMLK